VLRLRKTGVILCTYRHLNRYQQILRVLFKYGFQDFEVGLQLISRKRRERIEQFSRAERIRFALEELGQLLSSWGNAFPHGRT